MHFSHPLYIIPDEYPLTQHLFIDHRQHLTHMTDEGALVVFGTTHAPTTPLPDTYAPDDGFHTLADLAHVYRPTHASEDTETLKASPTSWPLKDEVESESGPGHREEHTAVDSQGFTYVSCTCGWVTAPHRHKRNALDALNRHAERTAP